MERNGDLIVWRQNIGLEEETPFRPGEKAACRLQGVAANRLYDIRTVHQAGVDEK